jgi:hypothetical protein
MTDGVHDSDTLPVTSDSSMFKQVFILAYNNITKYTDEKRKVRL